jgi:peptide chain release factor 3
VHCARWVDCPDPVQFKVFVEKNETRMARDHYGDLVYLASSSVNLSMTRERHPEVRFLDTKEHARA